MILIKKILFNILPNNLIIYLKYFGVKYFRFYSNSSYSEVGEDILFYKLFHPRKSENKPNLFKKDGFYIDIGCNHPVSNSQTYLMYKRGWRGIVIDPSPEYANYFKIMRPNDIYLPIGISEDSGTMTYYQYDLDVINSFDFNSSEKLAKELNANLIKSTSVQIYRLEDILSKYVPMGKTIDFLSIDTEGHEEKILKSNNWNIFRPKFVLLEIHNFDNLVPLNSNIVNYMVSNKYKLVSILGHNCLFEDCLNLEYSHFA
jgi:FkbM family methyltransferase